jgi:hypothetical protein
VPSCAPADVKLEVDAGPPQSTAIVALAPTGSSTVVVRAVPVKGVVEPPPVVTVRR